MLNIYVEATIPTVFNCERFHYKDYDLIIHDFGTPRILWQAYADVTNAVVYVIDSTDIIRLDDQYGSIDNVKDDLHRMFGLLNVPFLILANKQDIKTALGVEMIKKRLGIVEKCNIDNNLFIVETSAVTGKGLDTGFSWLNNRLLTIDKETKALHK